MFDIHTALKLYREDLEISRPTMAKYIEVSGQTIYNIEVGNTAVSLEILSRYAKFEGLQIGTFINELEKIIDEQ